MLMTVKFIGLSLSLALTVVCAEVEHKESRQLSYTMPASGKLIVDNVFGGIRVTSHSGREVRVNVEEHWTADTQEKLADGRKQVRLDATQDGNMVKLYVDGPFRCSDCCCNCCSRGDRGYRVRHHFEIAVPVDTALELKTVNGGSITAQGTRGDFDLRNVNGQIEVQDIAGSGNVHTVNGRIRVAFAENPRAPLSFKTINGEVAVEFQPGVSGDFRFRTRNGQAYTDFDIAALPAEPVQVEREGGKSVFRMNHFSGVRIGPGGGPEHRFETLNGNIRILKRGK
jgi:hypothetical protein